MNDRWLVVGLGNPGREYEYNRHNVGFLFLDYLIQKLNGGNFTYQKALQGKRASVQMRRFPLMLLKPETYMNLSGHSVQAACSYFKILSENTVICYDDVDIPFGTFRIRVKGSSGGHRGIASIIEQMGAQFIRIRFGIRPTEGHTGNLAGFVLSDFRQDELDGLGELFDKAYKAIGLIVAGRADKAMNMFNRRPIKPKPKPDEKAEEQAEAKAEEVPAREDSSKE